MTDKTRSARTGFPPSCPQHLPSYLQPLCPAPALFSSPPPLLPAPRQTPTSVPRTPRPCVTCKVGRGRPAQSPNFSTLPIDRTAKRRCTTRRGDLKPRSWKMRLPLSAPLSGQARAPSLTGGRDGSSELGSRGGPLSRAESRDGLGDPTTL